MVALLSGSAAIMMSDEGHKALIVGYLETLFVIHLQNVVVQSDNDHA